MFAMEKNLQLKNLAIEGSAQRKIVLDVYWSAASTSMPVVIFCHGFKGFKDWGAWGASASKLADHGYCVIKFNFSHNGSSKEDPSDLSDLEVFAQNNYSTELKDLQMVINWVRFTHILPKDRLNGQINIIGHSRGGGIALLTGAQDLRVSSVVLWASVSDYAERMPKRKELKKWKLDGVQYIPNSRTGVPMPMNYQFYEDFEKYKTLLNIKDHAKNLAIPCLILHGLDDKAVDSIAAKNLHKWIPNSELELIEDCGHTFNTKHPFDGDGTLPLAMQQVLDYTHKFLSKNSVEVVL